MLMAASCWIYAILKDATTLPVKSMAEMPLGVHDLFGKQQNEGGGKEFVKPIIKLGI